MNHDLPMLVIISGPPGGGKSTLARPLANALRLPLLEKDRVKERIADSLGDHAASISRDIGLAAVKQIIATADEILRSGNGVMVESFFHKGAAEADLAPLVHHSRAVLVHVLADDEMLLSRYERRMTDPGRHPIHNDGNRLSDLKHYLAEGVADILDLDCPHIVIDTTYGPVDPEEVAFMVQNQLNPEE